VTCVRNFLSILCKIYINTYFDKPSYFNDKLGGRTPMGPINNCWHVSDDRLCMNTKERWKLVVRREKTVWNMENKLRGENLAARAM
jgi:hypothetical protein